MTATMMDRASAEPSTSTLIGVGISVAGNLLISVALNLQKLAHRRVAHGAMPSATKRRMSRPESSPLMDHAALPNDGYCSAAQPAASRPQYAAYPLSYLSSPLWWLGFVLMSAGELGNFVSYGFAPASLVAPLGTVALVGNCLAAPILLGEEFQKRDWLGIGLAIIGTTSIVLGSPRDSEALSPDQLALAIRQLGFILYSCLCLLAILLLMCLSHTHLANRFIGIDVGLCAISGGFTVLSTKAFSSLLNILFLDCFQYPITWIMLMVMVVTAILQIIFLNRALQRYESKHVVPIQFVLFTIMAVIGSTILYGDFRNLGSAQVGNFMFACGFIFTGVYILTREDASKEEEEEEEEEPVSHEHRWPRVRCRHTSLTPVPEEEPSESCGLTDVAISPSFPSQSFGAGHALGTAAIQADQLVLESPQMVTSPSSSWTPTPFSAGSPSPRVISRQRSQPVLFPRAFGTPGYYLIASSVSRSHGTSHGFPALV